MNRYCELYRAEKLPVLQNRMFDNADDAIACARGDVVLVQDEETGLIFNSAFHPELMTYNADYQNEQAVSSVFRSHLDEVTAIVSRHFRGRALIEVGCGKGYFLEHLAAHGFLITGFDPAYEGSNPTVKKCIFSGELGLRGDGLILRHVLEHIQDPARFLARIREANQGTGRIYIEVPCLDWIARRRAWYDVFYEHVNYFRLDHFTRMFGTIIEAGHVFGGQYLFVVADLATLRQPRRVSDDTFSLPHDFGASTTQYAHWIEASRATTNPTSIVVWGGASKGVIFSLFMERAGMKIDHVVDINPAKQGRYLPATGLRVLSPAEMLAQVPVGSNIFVMNGNYLGEIKQMTHGLFSYHTVDHG